MHHKAVYLLFCKFTLHVSVVNLNPSSGVHKTVTTASGTAQLPPSNVAKGGSCTNIWQVPDAVVTVLCTPDDGCG